MAFRLLKFGTKVGIVGGVIYCTVDEGVWKDSEHTTELYSKIYKFVAPYVKEVPVEVPELPKISDITYTTKNYWNKGVTASFVFLSELPSKSAEWSKEAYEYVVKQLETNQQKNPNTIKN